MRLIHGRSDQEALVGRASVRSIALRIAGVCAALVLAGGLLVIAYIVWEGTAREQGEAPDRRSVRLYLDPLHVALDGLVIGLLAVACIALAAWFIARRAVLPLEEAFRLQRRFVADASHELRTPLAVLSARAQQLEALTPAEDPRAPVVASLREDVRFMARIVDDMLATAMPDAAGSAPAGPTPSGAPSVPLAPALTAAAEELRLVAAPLGVAVVAEALGAGAAPHGVAVPEVALHRCLVALLDNAVAHSPRGGTVTVSAGPASGAASAPGAVTIRVTDEGAGIVGIDPERIFERFAHGTAPASPGSRTSHGIGLALVRELATRHGGEVRLARTGPGGTEFLLTLPLAPGKGPSTRGGEPS